MRNARKGDSPRNHKRVKQTAFSYILLRERLIGSKQVFEFHP